jgi:hypothetical protein
MYSSYARLAISPGEGAACSVMTCAVRTGALRVRAGLASVDGAAIEGARLAGFFSDAFVSVGLTATFAGFDVFDTLATLSADFVFASVAPLVAEAPSFFVVFVILAPPRGGTPKWRAMEGMITRFDKRAVRINQALGLMSKRMRHYDTPR